MEDFQVVRSLLSPTTPTCCKADELNGGATSQTRMVMAGAPTALKRVKAEGNFEASDQSSCGASCSGLTRYVEETTLSFDEDVDKPATKIETSTQCKAGWTEAEDRIVLLAVRTFGTQWSAVADQLAGRTADAVIPLLIYCAAEH